MKSILNAIKENNLKSIIILYDELNKDYLNYVVRYLSNNLPHKLIVESCDIDDNPYIVVISGIFAAEHKCMSLIIKSDCVLSVSKEYIHIIKMRHGNIKKTTINISTTFFINKMLSNKINIYD